MSTLKTILISITTALAVFYVLYNFIPEPWVNLSWLFPRNLGSTITTINGSDTLSNSRSTINTNFTNLNNDKVQEDEANIFTALQRFSNASSTMFSCLGPCYFGTSATSSFSTAGALTLTSALAVASGGTATTTARADGLFFYNGTYFAQASAAGQLDFSASANRLTLLYASSTALTASGGTWLSTSGGVNNKVGIGTTSPFGYFSVNPDALNSSPSFAIGSSTRTQFIILNSGFIGISTTSPFARFTLARDSLSAGIASSSILVDEYKISTTTNKTIDWRDSNTQLFQIGASATTIQFVGYARGMKLNLIVCNPGGTAGAITWGTQVLWNAGTAPSQTTTANKCDVWAFIATEATSTVGALKIFGSATTNF